MLRENVFWIDYYLLIIMDVRFIRSIYCSNKICVLDFSSSSCNLWAVYLHYIQINFKGKIYPMKFNFTCYLLLCRFSFGTETIFNFNWYRKNEMQWKRLQCDFSAAAPLVRRPIAIGFSSQFFTKFDLRPTLSPRMFTRFASFRMSPATFLSFWRQITKSQREVKKGEP